MTTNQSPIIERVQTGIRIEKRILKVLKGIAEYADISLGDLIEGIVLHNFEGKCPFSPETLKGIQKLREVYGLDLTIADAHRMIETGDDLPGAKATKAKS